MEHNEYLHAISSTPFQSKIRGYIASQVYGHHNIEDVLQMTNKTLIEKFPSYREGGKIESWGIGIAFWTIKGWKKKQANAKVIFDEEIFRTNSYAGDTTFFESRDKEERLELLRSKLTFVLSRGSDKSKVIFDSYMAGDKPSDIRRETGYPITVIYKTIQRVKGRLKDILLKYNRDN